LDGRLDLNRSPVVDRRSMEFTTPPPATRSGGGEERAAAEHNQHHQQQHATVEKEHMFDKVVTPSDVGKLNRLVIPKQHAEKYFPLDAAANEKGLLLSFEDRTGKPWRFRYSYWNSSQSYVMTKGWSRFVKEKRLDAGDTVSFGRGISEAARGRLFIDWRCRPDPPVVHHQYHHRLPLPSAVVPYAPWAAHAHHHHYPADGHTEPVTPCLCATLVATEMRASSSQLSLTRSNLSRPPQPRIARVDGAQPRPSSSPRQPQSLWCRSCQPQPRRTADVP
jgi:hypothetical protein